MLSFHQTWAWVAIVGCGLSGLVGVGLALVRRSPRRPFWVMVGSGIVAVLIQVGAGLVLFARGERPGTFHVFYGIVISFSLAFAYIYRSQLARRPALSWGLLMLFIMGLGIRAMLTVE